MATFTPPWSRGSPVRPAARGPGGPHGARPRPCCRCNTLPGSPEGRTGHPSALPRGGADQCDLPSGDGAATNSTWGFPDAGGLNQARAAQDGRRFQGPGMPRSPLAERTRGRAPFAFLQPIFNTAYAEAADNRQEVPKAPCSLAGRSSSAVLAGKPHAAAVRASPGMRRTCKSPPRRSRAPAIGQGGPVESAREGPRRQHTNSACRFAAARFMRRYSGEVYRPGSGS
jgi:hypothetical protein